MSSLLVEDTPAGAPAAAASAAKPAAAATPPAVIAPVSAAGTTPPPAGAPPAATPPAAAAPPAEAKPEVYDLKLPEGALVDKARADEIAEFAKANKIPAKDAQALLERENALVAGRDAHHRAQHEAAVNSWPDAVKADPELGGEKFAPSVEAARRAIDRFASPALKEALNKSGFGNHPEMVRAFARIGLAMKEDKIVSANAGGTADSGAETLFAKSISQSKKAS